MCAYRLSAKLAGIHPRCGFFKTEPNKNMTLNNSYFGNFCNDKYSFQNEPSKVSDLHDFSPVISSRILYFQVLMVVRTVY